MRTSVRWAALLLLGGTSLALAAGPVGWRGDGTGRFPDAKPPAEWSAEKNVLWKAKMPGASYASPINVGDHLFVVSDPAELLCVRRSNGEVVWKKSVGDIKGAAGGGRGKGGKGGGGKGGKGGGMGGRSAGNSAATPVSNGKHVAAVFGNGVVAVYDLKGARTWAKFIEGSQVGFGHAASPVLLDDKVIVHLRDVVALNLATGKEEWRATASASHASLVTMRLAKEQLVITPAGVVIRAGDGKVLGNGKFRAREGSPVVDGDTVYVQGAGGLQAIQIGLDTDGKATFKTLWTAEGTAGGGGGGRGERKLPSPVLHDGLLYTANTNGMLEVIDAKKGERVYRQRLPVGQLYSSLALAGGQVFAFDTAGKAVVFKTGREFKRVAVNSLEGTGSCPVFGDEHLYVRGRGTLYCLSTKAKRPAGKE